jgi:ankyrin repeat protein
MDVVEVLIANGADIDAKDNKGWTPLQRAKKGYRVEVVKLLLEHGAKE